MKRTALLIDGGWFAKGLGEQLKLPGKWPTAMQICRNACSILLKDEEIFRIFYYDCEPYSKQVTNPIDQSVTDYAITPSYRARKAFFMDLGQMDFIALRRGELKARGWELSERYKERLLQGGSPSAPSPLDVYPGFQQKGVDMRIDGDKSSRGHGRGDHARHNAHRKQPAGLNRGDLIRKPYLQPEPIMKKFLIMTGIITMAMAGMGGWFAPPAAHAVDISVSPVIPSSQQYATSSIGGWVNAFYQFSLLIAGVLAFGAVVFGGVKYLTSAGNPSGQSEGKEWIKGALIGLLLLAAAYLILDIVNPAIVNLGSLPTLAPVQTQTQTPSTSQ